MQTPTTKWIECYQSHAIFSLLLRYFTHEMNAWGYFVKGRVHDNVLFVNLTMHFLMTEFWCPFEMEFPSFDSLLACKWSNGRMIKVINETRPRLDNNLISTTAKFSLWYESLCSEIFLGGGEWNWNIIPIHNSQKFSSFLVRLLINKNLIIVNI